MNCDCKDWVMSWHQIESAKVMASIHGQQYSGAKFKFCPWCGKGFTSEEDGVTARLNRVDMLRNTSVEEDNAMSRYVKERYHINSTVIPETDWQVFKGGKYGLGEDCK